MPLFRIKSVVVEARQFTGTNCIELLYWMNVPGVDECLELHTTDLPIIHTTECDMTTEVGDWVIKGVGGDFYPCAPDLFTEHYMAV